MKRIKKIYLILFVSLLGISATSYADIVGSYTCKGTDPFSTTTPNYTNTVNVTKNGDTYSFQWLDANGYPYIYGTGLIHKDLPDVVSVLSWDPTHEDYLVTVAYEIKSDGSLQGIWTLKSGSQTGTENCTK